MSKTNITLIIQLLKRVRQKPGLYMGNDVHAILHFITGVKCTCSVFGLQRDEAVYKAVVVERGWEYSAKAPLYQMMEKGMDYSHIINEVLSIEIDTWRDILELL
jgi:DNA gyrase/topoisomerase IV subunit B